MPISASTRRSTVFSVSVHAAVLGLLAIGLPHFRSVAIARPVLPGTADGTLRTVIYLPGGAPSEASAAPPPPTPKQNPPNAATRALNKPAPRQPEAPANISGAGSSGDGSLGEGNITIALVQFHPRPQPDLSSLTPGTGGDVILDAVIDEQGRIAKLTVMHGLGDPVDNTVLATVRQWTFAPATRNGTPTASEQEILFHYQRS